MKNRFLKVKKTSIVDASDRPLKLRGVNFGGWLMMEAYFMHAPNLAQHVFEKEFIKQHSKTMLEDLLRCFRDSFITEDDFKQVARWGMNCIRLPFHYKIAADPKTIRYLDQAIAWAKRYNLYIILDLHAAYGAQNHDWHSDSNGKAELWTKKINRQKTYDLWSMLADRYKNEPTIAGYDLLNEAVLGNVKLLNEFYREVIKAIRSVDKNHILFVEANRWAQDVEALDDFSDDNLVYSIHFYEPLEYTFNFVPFLKYPLSGWDKKVMRRRLEGYYQFSKIKQRPIHVGEFGVHYREGLYNECEYLKDELKCFNDFGFHWNYWTYKAVKNYMFPDGIFSYYPNSLWVHRPGPVTGWHRWKEFWPKERKSMVSSWNTKAFNINTHVIEQLQKAAQF